MNQIEIAKVNRDYLLQVAPEILGLRSVANLETKAIVDRLTEKFSKLKSDDTGDCDVCGGRSDATLDRCPFCGVDDDGKPPQVAAAPKTNGRALVKAGGTPAIVLDEVALDKAVSHVNREKGSGAVWAWKLGRYIFVEIYKTDLWRQRVKDGVGVYRSFDQFIEAELDLQRAFTYTIMQISQYFTEEEAAQFGTAHLRVLLSAPKEDHKMLLAKMKEKGLTQRGLIAEVESIRKRKKIKRLPRATSKKQAAAAMSGKEKVKAKRVTLSLKQESQTVKLACEAGAAKKIAALLETMAKKPHGVLVGENDAEMRIKLLESGGNLVLVVEPRRTDEG